MKITTLISLSVSLCSLLLSPALRADLSLNNDASQVNFISVKNEHIAEIHTFHDLSGTLSSEGKLEIKINLVSVDTLIPIRNERMQKVLFNVANYAHASFVADIDKTLASMPKGMTKNVSVEGLLTLNGKSVPMTFFVNVTSIDGGKINATTIKPSIIDASQFGLEDGINTLKDIAKLNSISKLVPLTFSVTFQ